MNVFKPTTFSWWQISLLKWAVLFLGVAIGATWPELFVPYRRYLVIVSLVMSAYLAKVWWRNK